MESCPVMSHHEATDVCRSFPSEGWQWEQRARESEVSPRPAFVPAACGAPAVWERCSPGHCFATEPVDSSPLPTTPPALLVELVPRTGSLKTKDKMHKHENVLGTAVLRCCEGFRGFYSFLLSYLSYVRAFLELQRILGIPIHRKTSSDFFFLFIAHLSVCSCTTRWHQSKGHWDHR